MITIPKITDTTLLAKTKIFHVEGFKVHFANGEVCDYERIAGRLGSVMVVPILDNETILLIREYAAGIEDYVLGFPKGAVEKSEDMLATANRELMEEAGYEAGRLDEFAIFSASPAYLASMMHVIVARDLRPHKLQGDEPEPIEVIPWRIKQVDELLAHPEFHEARSIAALLMVLRQWHEWSQ